MAQGGKVEKDYIGDNPFPGWHKNKEKQRYPGNGLWRTIV